MSIHVQREEAGLRIDKFLTLKFDDSRSYFQYLLHEGCVLQNGKKVKKKSLVREDDEIEIFFIAKEESSLLPQELPLDILFEDDHLLVINKPSGMVVHPAPGNWTNTFVNALLFHCKDLKSNDLRPGIVHRLDKDTSGVLVAAKTPLAHSRLIEQFAKRTVLKEYLAICYGKLESRLLSAPIGRHPVKRKEMTILSSGKEAKTLFTLLDFDGELSLIKAKLFTGRTHQIRVHLKHLNTPLIGDPIYGSVQLNKKYEAKRQLLHAYKLSFIHPITKKTCNFQAPIPEDFQKMLKRFEAAKHLA